MKFDSVQRPGQVSSRAEPSLYTRVSPREQNRDLRDDATLQFKINVENTVFAGRGTPRARPRKPAKPLLRAVRARRRGLIGPGQLVSRRVWGSDIQIDRVHKERGLAQSIAKIDTPVTDLNRRGVSAAAQPGGDLREEHGKIPAGLFGPGDVEMRVHQTH